MKHIGIEITNCGIIKQYYYLNIINISSKELGTLSIIFTTVLLTLKIESNREGILMYLWNEQAS